MPSCLPCWNALHLCSCCHGQLRWERNLLPDLLKKTRGQFVPRNSKATEAGRKKSPYRNFYSVPECLNVKQYMTHQPSIRCRVLGYPLSAKSIPFNIQAACMLSFDDQRNGVCKYLTLEVILQAPGYVFFYFSHPDLISLYLQLSLFFSQIFNAIKFTDFMNFNACRGRCNDQHNHDREFYHHPSKTSFCIFVSIFMPDMEFRRSCIQKALFNH